MGIQDVLSHNLTCAFRASSGLINYMSLPSNDSVLLCIPKFMVWWDRHYPVHDRVLRTNGNLVARGKHSVSTKTQQEAKSGFSKDQLSLGDGKALPKILKNCAVIHLQEAAKQHLYLPLTLKHHWIFKGMEKKGKEEERRERKIRERKTQRGRRKEFSLMARLPLQTLYLRLQSLLQASSAITPGLRSAGLSGQIIHIHSFNCTAAKQNAAFMCCHEE